MHKAIIKKLRSVLPYGENGGTIGVGTSTDHPRVDISWTTERGRVERVITRSDRRVPGLVEALAHGMKEEMNSKKGR